MRSPADILAELNALDRSQKAEYYRPRDASTLLILDKAAGGPLRVLMGRRHMRHRFLPGAWVFPGGRVDPVDSRVGAADDYAPEVLDRLMVAMKGPKTASRARAFMVAAVRETYEEAGIFVGKSTGEAKDGSADPHDAFANFTLRGLTPELSSVRFVARAITPPGRPRRFDTRFLSVSADAIGGQLDSGVGPSGELEDVAWVTFDEARARPELPPITRGVLDELEARLARDPSHGPDHVVPFYRWLDGRFQRFEIDRTGLR